MMSMLCNLLRMKKKTSDLLLTPWAKTTGLPRSLLGQRMNAQCKKVLRAYLWQIKGVTAGPLQGSSIVRKKGKAEDRSKMVWIQTRTRPGKHHPPASNRAPFSQRMPSYQQYGCLLRGHGSPVSSQQQQN